MCVCVGGGGGGGGGKSLGDLHPPCAPLVPTPMLLSYTIKPFLVVWLTGSCLCKQEEGIIFFSSNRVIFSYELP